MSRQVTEASDAVDAAVATLSKLDHMETVEHVHVYEEIQQVLAETLSSVDDA
ncbi:MAG TPA: hypothetical protein H9902_03845 [Candidatus Stackebrandtia faecavium]|nr:hypothetical protein [Candidatus Stackebrandtia faecavium]